MIGGRVEARAIEVGAQVAEIPVVSTSCNPDLFVEGQNKAHWEHADHRRHGWHNLHRIARYTSSLRAARVMLLEKQMDLRIAELDGVRHFTSLPWFSAMVVVRGQHVLFERYARDFGREAPHSVQSITKTVLNLIVGGLVQDGTLELSRTVGSYIPEVGSGYATATLQEVLNMDVMNAYTEDFADPQATYYRHEEVMGWRLPPASAQVEEPHEFLSGIASSDTSNSTGQVQYKDANTDVMGWVVERASGRTLRSFLASIVDAAGLEGALHITTARDGTPWIAGGACLTARDLARYFSLFARRGYGVTGERVGSATFIDETLLSGVVMPKPYDWIRYSNHVMVSGRSLGHTGWGGQYAVTHLDTGTIAVFLSVLEDEHAATRGYMVPIIQLLDSVVAMEPQ